MEIKETFSWGGRDGSVGQEHLLLFQRIMVKFQDPTWWLTIINSRIQCPFLASLGTSMHVVHDIHVDKTLIHTK